MSDVCKRVRLNVGGRRFETSPETLSGSDFLEALLRHTPDWVDKELFIDRDGSMFKHVLRLLRNPEYHVPHYALGELRFYGVESKAKESDEQANPVQWLETDTPAELEKTQLDGCIIRQVTSNPRDGEPFKSFSRTQNTMLKEALDSSFGKHVAEAKVQAGGDFIQGLCLVIDNPSDLDATEVFDSVEVVDCYRGLSGSLRSESFSSELLSALQPVQPPGKLVYRLPLWVFDLENFYGKFKTLVSWHAWQVRLSGERPLPKTCLSATVAAFSRPQRAMANDFGNFTECEVPQCLVTKWSCRKRVVSIDQNGWFRVDMDEYNGVTSQDELWVTARCPMTGRPLRLFVLGLQLIGSNHHVCPAAMYMSARENVYHLSDLDLCVGHIGIVTIVGKLSEEESRLYGSEVLLSWASFLRFHVGKFVTGNLIDYLKK
eukprot:gnl/Hemi2/10583_TR3661_c1_g3_i1.p1 gnl/Hemi2/10583_TR3661_c1_g3~~gnl/Hemi2/10583_TR3661_c1_g3_i1.p1  ORF type:complete len:431 (-),score=32.76 gnl/Hemi2/10583_TR3661_c1_g3_i1:72-1364(-)